MNKIEPISQEMIDALIDGLLTARMVADLAEKINKIIAVVNGESR